MIIFTTKEGGGAHIRALYWEWTYPQISICNCDGYDNGIELMQLENCETTMHVGEQEDLIWSHEYDFSGFNESLNRYNMMKGM